MQPQNDMKTDGQFELEDALEQLKKLPRATPPPDLLGRIESRLGKVEAKVIPMKQWRMIAAAACVLVALNVTALSNYLNSASQQTAQYDTSSDALISDFQLYE
ncbi:hypothetical protein [Neolewinella persica]|uniref:hypothetical protein n=1 Tax=Neolewinella persica TaxID=70998 RepID=UPI000373665D|nr:hypothetical protein [Neolewinella persica]